MPDNEARPALGKQLKALRRRARLTQFELATEIDVHEMTLRRWESGQREPRASEIAKLCEVLGVSEAELLNGPAEETREFTLIYDREGDLRMEVLNMAANAPEQRVMSVSPQRIAAMVNIKTANLDREEPEKIDAGRNGRAVRRGLGAAGEVEG